MAKSEPKQATFNEDDFFGWVVSFLRNHPALLLTLLYLYTSLIGILYTTHLYDRFGIDIVKFADARDFFLAAFYIPKTFVYITVTAGAFCLLTGVFLSIFKHIKKDSSPTLIAARLFPPIAATLALCWIFIFPVRTANEDYHLIVNGGGDAAYLDIEQSDRLYAALSREQKVQIIGSTSRFLFIYIAKADLPEDVDLASSDLQALQDSRALRKRAFAIPLARIRHIEIDP
ncbi:MAG: hypothetical protein GY835_19335 [bacterium]|nr:hypothetical protein [bacterium]